MPQLKLSLMCPGLHVQVVNRDVSIAVLNHFSAVRKAGPSEKQAAAPAKPCAGQTSPAMGHNRHQVTCLPACSCRNRCYTSSSHTKLTVDHRQSQAFVLVWYFQIMTQPLFEA